MNVNRMTASLANKISAAVGHRADLQLEDVRQISKTTAHFMISFASEVPTSTDLGEFFIRKFDAKITPYTSTAKVYPDEKVVTVVAGILIMTRDYEDIARKKVTPVIAGATYLDVPMQEIYEVAERGGKKVLLKKVKDSIMDIVAARRNAMMDNSSTKTFASVVTGSNISRYVLNLEKGDHVRAMIGDKVVECDVVSVMDHEVKVSCGGGGTETVLKSAILEVTRKATDVDASRKKMEEDYYTQAFGDPGYAKELVSGK
jgi:hypothetical protein